MAVLGDLAAVAEVIRNLQYDVGKLQVFLPLIVDRVIAQKGSENIPCNCPGRIAVAFVIDSRNDSGGKVILIFQGAVQGDSKGLLPDPAFSELMNAVKIAAGSIFGQRHRQVNNIDQIGQMRISRKNLCRCIPGFQNDLFQ